MARKQYLDLGIAAPTSEVFTALCKTLAFRRWHRIETDNSFVPASGSRYAYQTGSVIRSGRIVEVLRPVSMTLKEVLHDPPCRVALTMRWRVEPLATGCAVCLRAEYRLNHASAFRSRHWERRLAHHFRNQFTFLLRNLHVPAAVCRPRTQNVT